MSTYLLYCYSHLKTTRLAEFAIDKSLEDTLRGGPVCDEDSDDETETALVDDESVQAPACADIVPLDKTRVALEAQYQVKIREALRDSLFSDPDIVDTAEYLSIPDDEVMKLDDEGRLTFVLKASYFADWKARHQIGIGTQFKLHSKPR